MDEVTRDIPDGEYAPIPGTERITWGKALDDPAWGEINGKWFVIALPRVPWWRKLWAKIYVRWCHWRGQPVISAWDVPDEWKNEAAAIREAE